MKITFVRLIISACCFLAFTWASTVYYIKFIHDVGGTYWSVGIFGLPVVLFAVWFMDFYLKKNPWFQSRFGVLTVVDCLFAIVLYVPSLMLVWGVVYVFGIA